MSATGLAIIYVIIWWIIFFAILPIDVNRTKTVKIDGEDPGSPENPKMIKKFLYCTGITTIIFVIIYLLIKFEYLNLRNNPSEAKIKSHQLMLRVGMIKQASAGIYSWLPLGFKVMKKIEDIVRQEQNKIGAQEILMLSLIHI